MKSEEGKKCMKGKQENESMPKLRNKQIIRNKNSFKKMNHICSHTFLCLRTLIKETKLKSDP